MDDLCPLGIPTCPLTWYGGPGCLMTDVCQKVGWPGILSWVNWDGEDGKFATICLYFQMIFLQSCMSQGNGLNGMEESGMGHNRDRGADSVWEGGRVSACHTEAFPRTFLSAGINSDLCQQNHLHRSELTVALGTNPRQGTTVSAAKIPLRCSIAHTSSAVVLCRLHCIVSSTSDFQIGICCHSYLKILSEINTTCKVSSLPFIYLNTVQSVSCWIGCDLLDVLESESDVTFLPCLTRNSVSGSRVHFSESLQLSRRTTITNIFFAY